MQYLLHLFLFYSFTNMKNIFYLSIIALLLCIVTITKAQDIKTIKRTVSASLTEEYEVFKNNKKIKNGNYWVFDNNKQAIVKGIYNNDNKDSVWTYYNNNGEVIQRYNFKENKLVVNNADAATIVQQKFEIAHTATNAQIEPAVKIGGANYGFYLLYDERLIPAKLKSETRLSTDTLSYIFTVSALGKLERWDVKTVNSYGDSTIQNYSIKGLPTDAYDFVPAKVNGTPVESKLILYVVLNIRQDNNPAPASTNIMTSQKSN